MDTKHISYEVKNKVAYLGFGLNNKASVTTLGEETLKELDQILDDVASKQKKEISGLIFFSHKKGCFLAGADINLIQSLVTEQEGIEGSQKGQLLFNKIDYEKYK